MQITILFVSKFENVETMVPDYMKLVIIYFVFNFSNIHSTDMCWPWSAVMNRMSLEISIAVSFFRNINPYVYCAAW